MELLLKQNVEHLGRTGDLVDVKPGYARNFLLPHGMAVMVTKSNMAEVERARARAVPTLTPTHQPPHRTGRIGRIVRSGGSPVPHHALVRPGDVAL